MSRFDEKINKRLDRFYSGSTEVSSIINCGPFTVVTQRKFKGVYVNGNPGVYPVYDDVALDPGLNIGAVFIDGMAALVDLYDGSLLSDFEYDRIEFSSAEHSIVVYKEGLKGLFDVAKRQLVLKAEHKEINTDAGTRFTWTYSPSEGYTVLDSIKNKRIYLGHSPEICFDECHGHIFILKDGMVRMLTEQGMDDVYGYRELLASLGGRITLYNSSRAISAVADIYGAIL